MLQGYRTYITGAVIFVVALLQLLKIINFDPNVFGTVMAGLGGLAAIFLRASVNGK